MKYKVRKNAKVRKIAKVNNVEITLREALLEVEVNRRKIFNYIE